MTTVVETVELRPEDLGYYGPVRKIYRLLGSDKPHLLSVSPLWKIEKFHPRIDFITLLLSRDSTFGIPDRGCDYWYTRNCLVKRDFESVFRTEVVIIGTCELV